LTTWYDITPGLVHITLEIALTSKFTSGKWMLYRHWRTVDETWEKIAKATAAGKLGIIATVKFYACCIHMY